MRILLALNSETDASILSQTLIEQNTDCDIETVADGLSALITLIQKDYDYVVLDTGLTVIPGLELLRYLRMVGRKRPVILAGANPTFEQARAGILGRVSDFLTLPLSDADRYDFRLKTDGMPDHVDGYRTLEMALQIFEAVAQRLEACGEASDEWHQKLMILYNAYISYAFRYFSWLNNYRCLAEFYSDSVPEAFDFYREKLGDLIETIATLYPQTEEPLLRKVLEYLLQNIDQPLRQKDVAAQFFISPSSLSLLFTEHSSLVYNNYIFKLKLMRAAFLLRFSDMKIHDISARLGYQDSGYFSRQFKTAYGITPSEYRRER